MSGAGGAGAGGAGAGAAAGGVAGSGDGGGIQAQQSNGGAANGVNGANGGFDAQSVQQALEALQGHQQELADFLGTQPWRSNGAPEGLEADGEWSGSEADQLVEALEAGQDPFGEALDGELDGLDLGELDGGFDADGFDTDDPAALAQGLAGHVGEIATASAEAAVERAMGPVQEQVRDMRMSADFERLVNEHPEMGDPAVADRVFSTAADYARATGLPASVLSNVGFVRLIYAAGRAYDAAAAEEGVGAAEDAAHLEGGGGAGAGGSSSSPDLFDAAMSAGPKGRGVLPY